MSLIQHLITHSRTLELMKNKTSCGHPFMEYLCLQIRVVGAFLPYALCMDCLLVMRLPVTLESLASLWSHIAETCRALHFTPDDEDDKNLYHQSLALPCPSSPSSRSRSGEASAEWVSSPHSRVSPRSEDRAIQPLANRLVSDMAVLRVTPSFTSRLETVKEEMPGLRSKSMPAQRSYNELSELSEESDRGRKGGADHRRFEGARVSSSWHGMDSSGASTADHGARFSETSYDDRPSVQSNRTGALLQWYLCLLSSVFCFQIEIKCFSDTLILQMLILMVKMNDFLWQGKAL